MKYIEIQTFCDLYFLVYGQNRIRIFPYLDAIANSVQIQKNADMILPLYGKVQKKPYGYWMVSGEIEVD